MLKQLAEAIPSIMSNDEIVPRPELLLGQTVGP